jgi:hypothetical protein
VIGATAAAVGCTYVNPPALAIAERSDADPYFTLSAKDLATKVDEAQKSSTRTEQPTSYKASAYAEVLNKLVQANVLKREVTNRNIVITDEDKQVAQQELQSSSQSGTAPAADELAYTTDAVALARTLADGALQTGDFDLDSMARRLYDNAIKNGGLVTPGQLCLHFIEIDPPSAKTGGTPTSEELADVQAKAVAAKARIDAGETFEVVADDVSAAKGNVPGGDLGCRPSSGNEQGTLPAEFVDAIKDLQVGTVSNPISLQGSSFVIRLDDRIDEKVTPYEDVKDQAEKQAKLQLGTRFVTDRLREIYAKTVITIDPQFGRWDAVNLQVTTPDGAATPTTPTTANPLLDGLGVPASNVPASEPPATETTSTTSAASGTSSTSAPKATGSTSTTASTSSTSTSTAVTATSSTSTTSTTAVGP